MTSPNSDDELLVDLPEDGVTVDQPVKTTEDEGVDALKAQVVEAHRQREADKLAREESERRAAVASDEAARVREEAQRFRTEASDNRLNLVTTMIDNVNQAVEMAQSRMETAAQNGDYKALAVAQREISRGEAQLVQLEANKLSLEQEAKTPQRQQQAAPAMADPIERYAAGLTPRSAGWVKAHRDVVQPNGAPSPKLLAAHYDAMAHNIAADSDAYFAHIEERLGYAAAPAAQDTGQVVQLDARRQPVAAAPVSRDAPSDPVSPTRIRLTPAQVEAAEMCGMTPQEYAKALLHPDTKAALANRR